jgi:hypothetical protein
MHFYKEIVKYNRKSGATRKKGDRFFLAPKNFRLIKENLTKTFTTHRIGLTLCATRSLFSFPATLSIPATTNLTPTLKASPQLEATYLGNNKLATDEQISMNCTSLSAISPRDVVNLKSYENITTNIYWDPRKNDKVSGSPRPFSNGCKGSKKATNSCGGIILSDITASDIVNTNHDQKIAIKILETATSRSDFSFEYHTLQSVRISGIAQLEIIWKDKTSSWGTIPQSKPVGIFLRIRGDKFSYVSNAKVNNWGHRIIQKKLKKQKEARLNNVENYDIVKFSHKEYAVTYYLSSLRATGSPLGKLGRDGRFLPFESNIQSPDKITLNRESFNADRKKIIIFKSLRNIKTLRKISGARQSQPLINTYMGKARVINGTLIVGINLNPSKKLILHTRKIFIAGFHNKSLNLRLPEYKQSQGQLKYFSNYSTKNGGISLCQKKNLHSFNNLKISNNIKSFSKHSKTYVSPSSA